MTRAQKQRYRDALQDRMLPFVRAAFDAARTAVWVTDGNTRSYKPNLVGKPLKEQLDDLVDKRTLRSWHFDIKEAWGEYQVVIYYTYMTTGAKMCRQITFDLP